MSTDLWICLITCITMENNSLNWIEKWTSNTLTYYDSDLNHFVKSNCLLKLFLLEKFQYKKLHFSGRTFNPLDGSLLPLRFTCLRIISMVCMMQRGMRPWFLAKIMACSSVTFRVDLQRTKRQKVNSVLMCTCRTPLSKNLSRQWGEAALLLFSGACHPLCTMLIFIPADSLVVLHKQYNNVGLLPGWPLHACTTHGDVAGSQAVTQLGGHTEHADTWWVALGARAHVHVGLH